MDDIAGRWSNSSGKLPVPLVAYHEPRDAWFTDTYYQSACWDFGNGLKGCTPCPQTRAYLGRDYYELAIKMGYFALPDVLICIALLVVFWRAPQYTTSRNVYTVGMVAAFALLGSTFLFTPTMPILERHICYDDLRLGNGPRNPTCGTQGFLFLFGALTTRTLGLLWAIDVHLQVVWGRRAFASNTWKTPILVACSLPLIFAAISVPYSEWLMGPVCLPAPGPPLKWILMTPWAVTDMASVRSSSPINMKVQGHH